jgi:hypothetical protein
MPFVPFRPHGHPLNKGSGSGKKSLLERAFVLRAAAPISVITRRLVTPSDTPLKIIDKLVVVPDNDAWRASPQGLLRKIGVVLSMAPAVITKRNNLLRGIMLPLCRAPRRTLRISRLVNGVSQMQIKVEVFDSRRQIVRVEITIGPACAREYGVS